MAVYSFQKFCYEDEQKERIVVPRRKFEFKGGSFKIRNDSVTESVE